MGIKSLSREMVKGIQEIELKTENLNELEDVCIKSPFEGQMLKYNNTTENWKNVESPSALYYDRGDPVSEDFSVGDFTKDGVWYDLDLSSIVPEGATLVHLRVKLCAPSLAGIQFRKKGNVNVVNVSMAKTQVANVYYYQDTYVICDSNRVIQYIVGPVSWTVIDVTVRGWFKE